MLLFYFFSMHVCVCVGSHAHEYLCLWGQEGHLRCFSSEALHLGLETMSPIGPELAELAYLADQPGSFCLTLSLFCLRNFKSLILVQHGFLTFVERDRSKVSLLNGRHIPDCRIYLVLLGSFYNVVPPPPIFLVIFF